jgi:hypothetical protein
MIHRRNLPGRVLTQRTRSKGFVLKLDRSKHISPDISPRIPDAGEGIERLGAALEQEKAGSESLTLTPFFRLSEAQVQAFETEPAPG